MNPQHKFEAWILILCAFLIVISQTISKLPGMPERIYNSEFLALEKKLYTHYLVESISVSYAKGDTIKIDIFMLDASQKQVFNVIKTIRNTAVQDDFTQAILKIAQDKIDDHSWTLGCRPTIQVNISGQKSPWCFCSYSFGAGYYLERFNSGNAPDSYTYDGYATWTGVNRKSGELFRLDDVIA